MPQPSPAGRNSWRRLFGRCLEAGVHLECVIYPCSNLFLMGKMGTVSNYADVKMMSRITFSVGVIAHCPHFSHFLNCFYRANTSLPATNVFMTRKLASITVRSASAPDLITPLS